MEKTDLTKIKYNEILPENITDEIIGKTVYQNIKDNGKNADVILCLGCPSVHKVRLPHAIRLFKDGRAPFLLLSGGNEKDGETESARMKRIAIEQGVPEEKIITENLSTNTTENLIFSLGILSKEVGLQNINSIIIVTVDFHMPRTLLLAKKFLPDFIEIIPSPAKGLADINTWVGSIIENTVRGEFKGMYFRSDVEGGWNWWKEEEIYKSVYAERITK